MLKSCDIHVLLFAVILILNQYVYILSIYMCVYCILLCFIFCESLFLKTMMDSDIVLLTEVKLANHKPLRLWLPEPVCHQLYIYNTYWYIMYAYF